MVSFQCKACRTFCQDAIPEEIVTNKYAIVICTNQECGHKLVVCMVPACRYVLDLNNSSRYRKKNLSPITCFNENHRKHRVKLDMQDHCNNVEYVGNGEWCIEDGDDDEDDDDDDGDDDNNDDADEEVSTICHDVEEYSSDGEEDVVVENDCNLVEQWVLDCLLQGEDDSEQQLTEEINELVEFQAEIENTKDEYLLVDAEDTNYTSLLSEVETLGVSKFDFMRCNGEESYTLNQLYFAKKKYMKDKDPNNDVGGYMGLVDMCIIRKDKRDIYGFASQDETEAIFCYHQLATSVGLKNLKNLLRYDNVKMKLMGCNNENIRNVAIRFPSSMAQIRSFFMEGGSLSLMTNFPCSGQFRIGNHVCVGLQEQILIMAGHKGDFEFAYDGRREKDKQNSNGLNGYQAVIDLVCDIIECMRKAGYTDDQIEKACLGYFYFWSDSFITSFVKQKDNSVWIFTVTICPPQKKDKSNGEFTAVLAMGRSGEDHSEVIEHYYQEAIKLRCGFKCYLGKSNVIVDMGLGLLCHIADRPERKEVQHSRKEGAYGKVTNFAVCIDDKKLPACNRCFGILLRDALGLDGQTNIRNENHTCSQCLCWTINEKHDAESYSPVHKDYPKRALRKDGVVVKVPRNRMPGKTHLAPVKLDVAFMIEACEYAYECMFTGIWTKANTHQYLRSCNIAQCTIDTVINTVYVDKKRRSRTPSKEYLPKLWYWSYRDIFTRFTHPDAPLHGIAHGMVADNMDALHQIFAHWNKFTEFIGFANKTLLDIAELKLSWIKLKRLPKAAWIGENAMAYARLMSYLYGSYFVNFKFSNEVQVTLDNIRRLVNAFQSVLSCLMAETAQRKNETSMLFKILLSSAHKLHSDYGSLQSKDKKNKGKLVYGNIWESVSDDDVSILAKHLLTEVGTETAALKASIEKKMTAAKLKEKLIENGHDRQAVGNLKKVELQCLLFGVILQRQVSLTTRIEYHSSDKKEEEFWNKGAWLSFLVNIPDQIEYLGPLRCIW